MLVVSWFKMRHLLVISVILHFLCSMFMSSPLIFESLTVVFHTVPNKINVATRFTSGFMLLKNKWSALANFGHKYSLNSGFRKMRCRLIGKEISWFAPPCSNQLSVGTFKVNFCLCCTSCLFWGEKERARQKIIVYAFPEFLFLLEINHSLNILPLWSS